jgi:MATE family multidrug resistance protein
MAWPIVLANATVPLLGLADTAILGHYGGVADLGAIALGALIFNFFYWGFGFLRMSTTGFVAQAEGARDGLQMRAHVSRALIFAALVGTLLFVLREPMAWISLEVLQASADVEAAARTYVLTRIWGAPATLSLFAIMGTFVGLAETRRLLMLQILLNGLNIALDFAFTGIYGWGISGIAWGTVCAEWATCLAGLGLVYRLLRQRHVDGAAFWPWSTIRELRKIKAMLQTNVDIMIRTLVLIASFGWFTNQSASFGDATLAANHILLQLIGFSAHFLDGFAFAAESWVGRAIGAKDRILFEKVVARSTQLAMVSAALLSLAILSAGPDAISILTEHANVRDLAEQFLPYCAVYIFLSFAAFQLDGIFIGATQGQAMRNAALASSLIFALAWNTLDHSTNRGLWLAFICFVVARALCLGYYYPRLKRRMGHQTIENSGFSP